MHQYILGRLIGGLKALRESLISLCAQALRALFLLACTGATASIEEFSRLISALAHFVGELDGGLWSSSLSSRARLRRRASQVGRQSSNTRAELILVLSPSARRVEVVLVVSQTIAKSLRGERRGQQEILELSVFASRVVTHTAKHPYIAFHTPYIHGR